MFGYKLGLTFVLAVVLVCGCESNVEAAHRYADAHPSLVGVVTSTQIDKDDNTVVAMLLDDGNVISFAVLSRHPEFWKCEHVKVDLARSEVQGTGNAILWTLTGVRRVGPDMTWETCQK